MGGFNKVEIVYKCDLRNEKVENIFKKWNPTPEIYEVKRLLQEWTLHYPYYIHDKISSNHLYLQRRKNRRGLNAIIEVQYLPEVKELKVSISTPFSALFYLLLPLFFIAFLHDEIFAIKENGCGLLIGLFIGLAVLLTMISTISISEKGDVLKDIEEQLYFAGIKYVREKN